MTAALLICKLSFFIFAEMLLSIEEAVCPDDLYCEGLYGTENAWQTLSICLLYATFDEAHQMLVPRRSLSLVDVSYSWFGVLLFAALAL